MATLSLLRRRAGARRFSHDSNKSRRVQARAADQRAVDLGLGHELVDVLGLDAAAVEDPDALGDLLRPELREQTAQIPVDFAGLARCRVDARPDGPDRLVGEDDLPELCGRHAGEPGAQLALHRREGKSLAPLLGSLAGAEDGREATVPRRAELYSNHPAGQPDLLPPLVTATLYPASSE